MEVITISKELRVNEQIRCREIRVIDEQGSQIGVMNPRDAMKLADEKGLDLVEVSPGASHRFAALWIMANIAMNRTRKSARPAKTRR